MCESKKTCMSYGNSLFINKCIDSGPYNTRFVGALSICKLLMTQALFRMIEVKLLNGDVCCTDACFFYSRLEWRILQNYGKNMPMFQDNFDLRFYEIHPKKFLIINKYLQTIFFSNSWSLNAKPFSSHPHRNKLLICTQFFFFLQNICHFLMLKNSSLKLSHLKNNLLWRQQSPESLNSRYKIQLW